MTDDNGSTVDYWDTYGDVVSDHDADVSLLALIAQGDDVMASDVVDDMSHDVLDDAALAELGDWVDSLDADPHAWADETPAGLMFDVPEVDQDYALDFDDEYRWTIYGNTGHELGL